MSTLTVANVSTLNSNTELTISSGNTSAGRIVISSNNISFYTNSSYSVASANSSGVFIGNTSANSTSFSVPNLTATGQVIFSGNVTPANVSSNTSAWNPDSSDSASVIRVQASANNAGGNTNIYEAYISGLTAGVDGQIYTIQNISGQKIQLRKEDSVNETTAANRFNFPDHIWLGGFQSIEIYYDATLARWRLTDSVNYSFDHKYSLTKGFWCGGLAPAAANNRTDMCTYSTETTADTAGAYLSTAKFATTGAGNADKGFISGGATPAYVATADRITYSTSSLAAVSGANLSQVRGSMGAAGNSDKGFFSGGINPATVATADRTTYSTETTAAVTAANLSAARYYLAAAGNSDKGFFAGGTAPLTTNDRTNYSTEVTAVVTGAALTTGNYGLAAAGNAEKCFFSGGIGAVTAAAFRTTYSSETTAAVAGANLSQARGYISGAGNDVKGFFIGGQTPTVVTTADKTTYSNETTSSIAATLSVARSSVGSV